jgi:hypothetical protein
MLELTYNGKNYSLPLHSGRLSGSFCLDEDWRDLDYASSGNSLDLTMVLYYSVPQSAFEGLLDMGFVNDVEQPLLFLEFEILHTQWDHELDQSVLIGNLKRFSGLHDMEGLKLSPEICKNSTLWFPGGMSLADIESIEFGNSAAEQIAVRFSGSTSDRDGRLDFAAHHTLSFEIEVRIEHGNHVFKGKSVEERFSEIRECFASLYDAKGYSAKERVIDPADNSVAIVFTPLTE